MNRNFVLLAGIGVVGFLGYMFLRNRAESTGGVAPLLQNGSKTYAQSGTQGTTQAPRVDNANQPWYGGSTQFQQVSQQAYDMKNIASYLDSGSSIVHSISDIWGDLGLSEMFGKEESWDDIAAMDWDTPISWDANDNGMGGLDLDSEAQTDTMYAYV